MKLALDSNIIIAAFAARGLCSALFEVCIEKYTAMMSDHILTEVRKAFLRKLKMPEPSVTEILDYLRELCVTGAYRPLTAHVSRDRDDDKILALAVAGEADYIVTGDHDLLVLKKYGSVKIITPREFWHIVKEESKR